MAKKKTKKHIEQYQHEKDERTNVPHVGLATPTTDPDIGEKKPLREAIDFYKHKEG